MLGLILGAVAALGLGIWLGLPGRAPSVEDVERTMRNPLPESRKVKRRFTPLAWAQRHIGTGVSRAGRGFRVERPGRR
ncbi:MAG TPA: hypothetical protein VLH75_02920 [Longimicrobiales bacterium]|nr:hypothetical protein [Longimicrobiales bacterium]